VQAFIFMSLFEWEYAASQIETLVFTRRTTTHQSIWRQQHTCGALCGSPMECGIVGQHYETPHFRPCHRYQPAWSGPSKNSVRPA